MQHDDEEMQQKDAAREERQGARRAEREAKRDEIRNKYSKLTALSVQYPFHTYSHIIYLHVHFFALDLPKKEPNPYKKLSEEA